MTICAVHLARCSTLLLFDAVFLADVIGTYDGYRGGPETALREAVQIPSNHHPGARHSGARLSTPPLACTRLKVVFRAREAQRSK